MVNLLPFDNLVHCNFIVEKTQVWLEWRPAVRNFTIIIIVLLSSIHDKYFDFSAANCIT